MTNPTLEELGIDRLSVEQRIDLIGQIWDSIVETEENYQFRNGRFVSWSVDWQIPDRGFRGKRSRLA